MRAAVGTCWVDEPPAQDPERPVAGSTPYQEIVAAIAAGDLVQFTVQEAAQQNAYTAEMMDYHKRKMLAFGGGSLDRVGGGFLSWDISDPDSVHPVPKE